MVKRGVFFLVQIYCLTVVATDDLGSAIQQAFSDQAILYQNVVSRMDSPPQNSSDQLQTLRDLASSDIHSEASVQLVSTNAE